MNHDFCVWTDDDSYVTKPYCHHCRHSAFVALANLRYINALNNNNSDHSSQEIENRGHRSRSTVNKNGSAVALTSILDQLKFVGPHSLFEWQTFEQNDL